MNASLHRWRSARNVLAMGQATLAALVGLSVLASIQWTTFGRRLVAFNPALCTEMTPPSEVPCRFLNASVGSALIWPLAIAIGAPLGVAAGTWLADLKERYAVVIVNHDLHQAARCSDQTVFICPGEMVETGATDRIFTNPGKRRTEDYVTGSFG